MAESTLYYHVDMTHASYNAMKSQAVSEFAVTRSGNILSVVENLAVTEAFIKIIVRDDWSPGWESAPFILGKFDETTYRTMLPTIKGPLWEEAL